MVFSREEREGGGGVVFLHADVHEAGGGASGVSD